jgi:predicted Zn-dependent protease
MNIKTLYLLSMMLLSLVSQSWAREGVDVGRESIFSKLAPAGQIEEHALLQFNQIKRDATSKRALGSDTHPQVIRLRRIANELIPFALQWNPRAKAWHWEVILINSPQVNAFCMPGGKIAFYTGILDKMRLTDDEAAMVMGHEIAHALREHARERMGKGAATQLGAAALSRVLGVGQLGHQAIAGGAHLLSLEFSRENESEADLVGMELAARAGFDPRSGISLWSKMSEANKNSPPQWLSTHPSGKSRIAEIQANLPKVMPLYRKAISSNPHQSNSLRSPLDFSPPKR